MHEVSPKITVGKLSLFDPTNSVTTIEYIATQVLEQVKRVPYRVHES